MVNRKIIFLGGIHGAGKGVVSEILCTEHKLEYLSASELIKWEEIRPDISNKTIDNVSETQEYLIERLSNVCIPDKVYLLDGHFCLLNPESEPIKVGLEVFKKINPYMLLIITAEPKIIKERLMNRDKKVYDLNIITTMQNEEERYAKEVANNLNIPLYHIYSSNVLEISKILKKYL